MVYFAIFCVNTTAHNNTSHHGKLTNTHFNIQPYQVVWGSGLL